jgi:plasmid stability protein
MGAMTVRNLDPKLADVLRRRARAEGRSMNDLVVAILSRAAEDEDQRRRMREQRPRAEKLRRALRRRFGAATPSEKLLRKDRGR